MFNVDRDNMRASSEFRLNGSKLLDDDEESGFQNSDKEQESVKGAKCLHSWKKPLPSVAMF